MKENILEIKNLSVNFDTSAGKLYAIRDVSLALKNQEVLAIVGESGSGKSVTMKAVMRLLAENAIINDGEIIFNGEDLLKKTDKKMDKIRGSEIALVMQDPMTSLNPLMTIGKQVAEPIILHSDKNVSEARAEALEMLERVGIPNAKERFNDYPFQFSGGQRQRINIAMALASSPRVLIADEPTTALDVTVQAQIIELFEEFKEKRDMSIIFITHDLGVVANIADKVAVMYAGKIIEYGLTEELFYNPQHPYTWGLLSSLPNPEMPRKRINIIPGTPPNLISPPKGDAFAPRNKYSLKIDYEEHPPFFDVSSTHKAATWLLHPFAEKVNPPQEILMRQDAFRKGVIKEGEANVE